MPISFLSQSPHPTDQTSSHLKLIQSLSQVLSQAGINVYHLPPALSEEPYMIARHALCHQGKILALDSKHPAKISPYIASFLSQKQHTLRHTSEPGEKIHQPLAPMPVHFKDNTAYVMQKQGSLENLSEKIAQTWQIRCVDLVEHANQAPWASFLPIDEAHALCYLEAFDKPSQQKILQEFEVIPVPYAEVILGACGAIVVDKSVYLPSECSETAFELSQRGFNPIGIQTEHENPLHLNDLFLRFEESE